ncbi:MAG: hypothetical protein J0H68_08305 [Sphingobacteriia bacterium]|nr:hypothetical protein [Sphingobacteriia bacterium]
MGLGKNVELFESENKDDVLGLLNCFYSECIENNDFINKLKKCFEVSLQAPNSLSLDFWKGNFDKAHKFLDKLSIYKINESEISPTLLNDQEISVSLENLNKLISEIKFKTHSIIRICNNLPARTVTDVVARMNILQKELKGFEKKQINSKQLDKLLKNLHNIIFDLYYGLLITVEFWNCRKNKITQLNFNKMILVLNKISPTLSNIFKQISCNFSPDFSDKFQEFLKRSAKEDEENLKVWFDKNKKSIKFSNKNEEKAFFEFIFIFFDFDRSLKHATQHCVGILINSLNLSLKNERALKDNNFRDNNEKEISKNKNTQR